MAERTSTCSPQTETRTLQVYLYMPQALSFIGGGQGSRLRGNGGVESRWEFFGARVHTSTVDCASAMKQNCTSTRTTALCFMMYTGIALPFTKII